MRKVLDEDEEATEHRKKNTKKWKRDRIQVAE